MLDAGKRERVKGKENIVYYPRESFGQNGKFNIRVFLIMNDE
jgi:hypothetical protein